VHEGAAPFTTIARNVLPIPGSSKQLITPAAINVAYSLFRNERITPLFLFGSWLIGIGLVIASTEK
jgi:hypothetical protein